MLRLWRIPVLLAVAGAALLIILSGCASEDTAAARRANAEAALVSAQANAAVREQAALTAAQTAATDNRIAQQEAAHRRFLELLPFYMGGVLCIVLVGLAAFGVLFRTYGNNGNQALMLFLEESRARQLADQRDLWRAVAALERPERRHVMIDAQGVRGGDYENRL